MRYILFSILLAFSTAGLANGNGPPDETGPNCTGNHNCNVIGGGQGGDGGTQSQSQTQGVVVNITPGTGAGQQSGDDNSVSISGLSGGEAGEGGVSNAYAGGSHSGASANSNINIIDEAPDNSEWVPDASAPALTSSGVCYGSFSAGGSGPGIGLSFGKTVEDDECQARENARVLFGMGAAALAMEVMCGIEEVAEADAQAKPYLCASNKMAEETMPNSDGAQDVSYNPELLVMSFQSDRISDK